MAYGLRAKISPEIELDVIEIRLSLNKPPVIRLQGTVRHARSHRMVGTGTIATGIIGSAGIAFIEELKEAFGAKAMAARAAVSERANEKLSLGRYVFEHRET